MEVITLQFGHFANHVGAHFWNFEDEIAAHEEGRADDAQAPETDFERLHHQTELCGTVSWHPRLLLVDLKGALCSTYPGKQARQQAPELEVPGVLWEHGTVSHCSEFIGSHPFQQDLDDLECEEDRAPEGQAAEFRGGADVRFGNCYPENDGHMDVDVGTADVTRTLAGTRPSAFYNFSETVRSWTDYLKIPLEASNAYELSGWHHGVSPFATFFDGLQFQGSQDEEPVLELARRQLELCDCLDAVHAVIDMHDGFGGVADVVLRWVREEQPKCGQLAMAVQPAAPAPSAEPPSAEPPADAPGRATVAALDAAACAWVSAAFSFAGLAEGGAEVYAPCAVPLWEAGRRPPALAGLRQDSAYETGALLAAALQTATLPYRLRGGWRPRDFLAALAPARRPVCGLLLGLPLPCPPAGAGAGAGAGAAPGLALAAHGQHLLDLASTPLLAANPHASVVLRGGTPRRLLELCAGLPARARRLSLLHPEPLPLPLPFPQVFGPGVSPAGAAPWGPAAAPARAAREDVEACPAATCLHAAAPGERCAPLQCMASAVRAHERSAWAAALRQRCGVEADEFREVLEAVTEHLECGGAALDGGGDQ